MFECVVDCELKTMPDGTVRVMPVAGSDHIHEPIVRCRDCAAFSRHWDGSIIAGYCRKWNKAIWDDCSFCHRGEVRNADKEAAAAG